MFRYVVAVGERLVEARLAPYVKARVHPRRTREAHTRTRARGGGTKCHEKERQLNVCAYLLIPVSSAAFHTAALLRVPLVPRYLADVLLVLDFNGRLPVVDNSSSFRNRR